jgi:very-short-patch-repair endonuclease/predicted DNA-binding protein YlxM (UPF0122 family)
MRKTKYDWNKIEKYCGDRIVFGKEIEEKFGATTSAVTRAIQRGVLNIKRCKSELKIFDWSEMQKDIDSGFTTKELRDKYGCSAAKIDSLNKKGLIKTRTRSEALKLSHKNNPQSHSEETKEKISKIRKQYILENPDKAPYLLNHYRKGPSYPEKYFSEVFEKENIKLEKYYNFYTYQLDFADVVKQVDIEIDGSQHRYDKRIVEHDIKRNNFLASKGWKVFRVYWPEFQKKNREEREKVVEEIKNLLK